MLYRGGPYSIADGRLTLESGEPVPNSDQTAGGTIYYTPYVGNQIALFDTDEQWVVHQFSEISKSLTGLTASTPYDIFVEVFGNGLRFQELAWASATARTFAISQQNGVWVQDTSKTRRYVGTIYIDATGNSSNDTLTLRHVWNVQNRRPRPMQVLEATNSWNYSTAVFRQANASAANQFDIVVGLDLDQVHVELVGFARQTISTNQMLNAIGVDSTSAAAAACIRGGEEGSLGEQLFASLDQFVGIGRHTITWLEWQAGGGVGTFVGDDGGTVLQSGMVGHVFA